MRIRVDAVAGGLRVWVRCLCLLAAAVSFAAAANNPAPIPVSAAVAPVPETGISAAGWQQIDALLADKAQRGPLQLKIDSQLIYARRLQLGQSAAPGVPAVEVDLDIDAAGFVLVDLDLEIRLTGELLDRISLLGGRIVYATDEYPAIRVWLPIEMVETVAAWPEIAFVRQAVRAFTNVGELTSEGDVTHRADLARTTFHVNGAGVKVAVLSDSVDHLEGSQASGDLGEVTVLPGQSGLGQNNSGEGTAMLEIIHDLAPGAQLYFATAFAGPASFAQNIRNLRFQYGCDIIVDDVGYFNESPFQDDVIAQAVNDVTADGALFFSSAANSGNKNDNQSGTWEGDFADSGVTRVMDNVPRPVHAFGNAAYNTVIAGGSSRHVDLFWADPLKGSANDYDVFVLDSAGNTVVGSSTNPQSGTQDPYEFVPKLDVGQRIVIVKYDGQLRYLHLSTGRGRLAVSTAGNTRGHSCAVDAFGVAAVDVGTSYPDPFTGNQKNPVETFSSDGPRRVFFQANGTALTPGNFTSTGGAVRQKPDIAAADGGRTTVPGFDPFFGTSAAAPHAAAIAALIKSYNPALTPAQIRSILTTTALDIESPGVDRDSGHGLIMALAALGATPSAEQPAITGVNPANGGVGSSVTLTGTKLNGATAVQFHGTPAPFDVQSATRITTTVPAGAATGKVTVSTPSGTATSPNDFTVLVVPAITGFAPASGDVGTVVTLTGANLAGATAVRFNGISAAEFTVLSATNLTARVPTSATTGRITVQAPGGTAESATLFSVITLPAISAFLPTSGGPGTTVTIDGANFTGATAVLFHSVAAASYTVVSAQRITAVAPAALSTGPISVTTPVGTAASTTDFVAVAVPTITALVPVSAPVGATVLIQGTNLGGATRVEFNGQTAVFVVDSGTQILAAVPAGAATGLVTVTTPGGTTTSPTTFTVIAPPPNDSFAAAQSLASNPAGSVTGANRGATKEVGEPDHGGNPGGRSVWYRWTAPSAGVTTFDTLGSGFDTLLAVYLGGAVSGLTLVANSDDLPNLTNSLVTFVTTPGTSYAIAVDGYRSELSTAGEASSGSLQLNWTSSSTLPAISSFQPDRGEPGTLVTVRGVNLGGITVVTFQGVPAAFRILSPGEIAATVPADAPTGFIQVASATGSARALAPFTVVHPPPNDSFSQAQRIEGPAGFVLGNNRDAGKQSGEPAHAANAGGGSVWYRWVAPSSGPCQFDTQGSTFDTLLAVYTGDNLVALTPVVSNDDSSPGPTSRVFWTAQAGQEYRVAVDGRNGATGDISLSWSPAILLPGISSFAPASGPIGSTVVVRGTNLADTLELRFNGVQTSFTTDSGIQVTAVVPLGANTGPVSITTPNGTAVSPDVFTVTIGPPNDPFASPEILPATAGVVARSTVGASKEPTEPDHAEDVGGRSVWFAWTAPSNGTWRFDTGGSQFDTLLAAYTGSTLASLTPAESNDDARFDLTSEIFLEATAGATYYIAVDGYSGDSGEMILKYHPTTEPEEIYATGFEASEGYDEAGDLAGQNGWISTVLGGNGILFDAFGDSGQQAYVGLCPETFGEPLTIWQPLNHTPNLSTRPVVRFQVWMAIIDSENGFYDYFWWSVYNRAGERLFTVEFDNYVMTLWYVLDDGEFVDTGYVFDNDTLYFFEMTMDFARNRWTAYLDGDPVIEEQPITTGTLMRDLGDIDAVWVPDSDWFPGDNLMVFDDYLVQAEPSELPRMELAPTSQTATAGNPVTLAVVASGREPLLYQWSFRGVSLPGATNATLALPSIASGQAGAYTVDVSNALGSANATATLTVHPALPATLSGRWIQAEQRLEFSLQGTPGTRYRIESSPDLAEWRELTTVILPAGGRQVFFDPAAGLQPRRYYRASSP